MSKVLTNNTGLSLAMAVWLAHDDYDNGASEVPEQELVSATTLLKPTRQFVLSQRVPPQEEGTTDVTDLIASSFGTAVHDSVENAWKHYPKAMKKLGYPQKVIDSVMINPTDEELAAHPNPLPVYLEQRYFRTIDGVTISGKFDQIIDGALNDTKTTSVFGYMNGFNEEKYRLQLSIYRWLNPDKVTSDIAYIQLVFTDWQRMMVKQNPKYPKHRVLEFKVNLLSLAETEAWIMGKLTEIRNNVMLDQDQMIRCNDEDLWRSAPKWKYYANPEKMGRATKNFDDPASANAHKASAGKGVVIHVPGKVKACGYCSAFPICKQKDEYDHD